MSMGHWFLKGLSLKFSGSRKHCKLQNEAFCESGVFLRLLPHRVPLDKGWAYTTTPLSGLIRSFCSTWPSIFITHTRAQLYLRCSLPLPPIPSWNQLMDSHHYSGILYLHAEPLHVEGALPHFPNHAYKGLPCATRMGYSRYVCRG